MKIVAQSENWYLVQTGEQTGRVYDFGRNRLFAPMSLVALLARGGWESFVGDARPVLDAIGDAEEVGPAPAGQSQVRAFPERGVTVAGAAAIAAAGSAEGVYSKGPDRHSKGSGRHGSAKAGRESAKKVALTKVAAGGKSAKKAATEAKRRAARAAKRTVS